jgi:hypothetical protein
MFPLVAKVAISIPTPGLPLPVFTHEKKSRFPEKLLATSASRKTCPTFSKFSITILKLLPNRIDFR